MNTNCIFGLLHFYDITYIIVGLGPSPNPNSNPTDRKGVVPSRRIDFLLDWKKHQNVLGIRSEQKLHYFKGWKTYPPLNRFQIKSFIGETSSYRLVEIC